MSRFEMIGAAQGNIICIVGVEQIEVASKALQ